MQARVLAVIPARWAATRFPGKLLAELHGRPLLHYVYRRALRVEGVDRLLIATDDERIERAGRELGAEVVCTSSAHASGTDRVGEVVEKLDAAPDFVLNLQGDEPLLPVRSVSRMVAALRQRPDAIWTLAHPIREAAEFQRSSVVKVVVGSDARALYFSRAPIPFARTEREGPSGLRHVGVYGYPIDLLRRFLSLEPSPLERTEGLEQLRALEAGIDVRVAPSDAESPGVDVEEDLDRLQRRYPDRRALEIAGLAEETEFGERHPG